MRRIGIFVSMIGLLGITFCFAEEETITITTYYPSPFGVYKCLRLAPYSNCGKNPGPCGDCDNNSKGTMCYNGDEGLLYICNDPEGWQIASGLWEKADPKGTPDDSDDVIYPRISDWGVGIGTDDPDSYAKLTIEGSIDNNIANLFWRSKEADCNAVGFLGVGRGSDYGTVDDNVLIGAVGASYTNLIFRTDDKSRMMITNDGNVGIGMTNPGSYDGEQARLDVGTNSSEGYTAVDDVWLKNPKFGSARWASKGGGGSLVCTTQKTACSNKSSCSSYDTQGYISASCPADYILTGGACYMNNGEDGSWAVEDSWISGNTYYCGIGWPAGKNKLIAGWAQARCCKIQ